MKRAFMAGMFVTSVVLLTLVAYTIVRSGVKDDGAKLQYVYQVMVEPGSGGPTYICASLPRVVDSLLVEIQDIRSTRPVYVSRTISLFIMPSDKPVDVEDLRRKLLAPVLETQEALGPAAPSTKG